MIPPTPQANISLVEDCVRIALKFAMLKKEGSKKITIAISNAIIAYSALSSMIPKISNCWLVFFLGKDFVINFMHL
jgi:hypothetical protein